MVSLDISKLLFECESDSFAAAAINVLFGASYDFDQQQLSRRLSGRTLLTLCQRDQSAFCECCEQIVARPLEEDDDDWVYDDYLLFFSVVGSIKWSLKDDAARKIATYRLKRSEKDRAAAQCLAALDRKPPIGVYDFVAYSFSEDAIRLCEKLDTSLENSFNTLQESGASHVLERLLSIKTILFSTKLSGINYRGEDRVYPELIRAIHTKSDKHAKIEFWLILTLSVQLALFLIGLSFWGDEWVQGIIGKLSTAGIFVPFFVMLWLLRKRKKLINMRTAHIFKSLTNHDLASVSNAISILNHK